jgi:hypothetical protein
MSVLNSGSDSGRYIVRSDNPMQLHAFITSIGADPRMALIDTIGPPEQPHTVIVSMPHDMAHTLQERYANQLIIEPDRPLSLFGEQLAQALVTEGITMPKTPETNAASPDTQDANPARPRSPAPAGESQPQAEAAAGGRKLAERERKGQFLIAARKTPQMQMLGIAPLSFGYIEQTLRSAPDIEVVDTVGPKNIMGALADGFAEVPSVLVARMSEQKAATLHQQAQGRLIVERDQPLTLAEPAFQPPLVAGTMAYSGPVLAVPILVLGKDNAPLKDAEVYLFGSLIPATGVTDERGQVTLTLYGETLQSIRAIYVKPKCDYWSFYLEQPDMATNEANIVALRQISDGPSLSNFPRQQLYTWGQRAMRLDQLPGEYRGQGVKVAVIDSGVATTHDDLSKMRFGMDIVNKKTSPNTWNEDVIAHGSHCTGVIAGADNARGIRGFAPDAEVHACKLFPGGQVSQLIDALEYCIEHQIDVANLSLGGAEPSEALEQQLLRAKRAGVACIVAAGNSGGPVQYPASSPNVLAVAAIGKVSEFPADSYHSQTMTRMVDPNGFFAAKFSCFGPEVAVCAPGVAITSSVPPNNFAVWDGTSMATPHVTGLAALVLAHHPDFQGPFKARGPERVERLFQIIKASARRLGIPDAARTGFGLPDVLVAVGLQPGVAPQPGREAFAAPQTMMGPLGFNPYLQAYTNPAQLMPQGWLNAAAMQSMGNPYSAMHFPPGPSHFGFSGPVAFGAW